MRVIHLMGADSFTDPDTGTTWEAGDDGVFELPEHVGAHYVTRHAGMFRRESDHEALLAAKKAEALSNPSNTAPTLKALLERVTALEGKVAAWEEFFGGDALPQSTPLDTGKAAKEPEPAEEAPAEDSAQDGDEDPDEDGEEPEPAEDAPLRKPTPRKTATKRR